ncbi:hypothetical protein C8J56DRAFT_887103 [Mycena floridula]|nr:hypothetical protein C8J56DRAFT_887103 [Mycena floridula]
MPLLQSVLLSLVHPTFWHKLTEVKQYDQVERLRRISFSSHDFLLLLDEDGESRGLWRPDGEICVGREEGDGEEERDGDQTAFHWDNGLGATTAHSQKCPGRSIHDKTDDKDVGLDGTFNVEEEGLDVEVGTSGSSSHRKRNRCLERSRSIQGVCQRDLGEHGRW